MRIGIVLAAAAVCVALTAPVFAQQGVSPQLFASSADVKALIAKARTERKADQANFVQPIVALAPYRANLEYRVGTLNAPASSHDKDAELFYVIEGTGSVVTGGTIQNERRTNADNAGGTGIEGGTVRRIGPGDVILVPEKTPHWFTQIDGVLVLMSLHLPH